MTQKERLMKAFMNTQSIRNSALSLKHECSEYSRTAAMYADSIIAKCDEMLKYL